MNRGRPLGFDREPPSPDGVAPDAGSSTPGPITPVTPTSSTGPSGGPSSLSSGLGDDDAIRFPFEVSDQFYRLRRTETTWYRGANEVNVPPADAVGILERAISQHDSEGRLVRLLEVALRKLAGLHEGGVYVLLRLIPEARVTRVETSAPSPRPSAPRVPEPPAPPPMEEPMVPLAQATALKNAAALGVPFCEECARLAAERAGQTA